LLAISENQPDPSNAKSTSEILAMHQAGRGWALIAQDLGCKNLSAVIKNAASRAADGRETPEYDRRKVRPALLTSAGRAD